MNRAKERIRKERLARNMREMRALLCANLSGERRKRHALQAKGRFFLPLLAVFVLLFGLPPGVPSGYAAPLAPESPAPHPARAGQPDPGTVVLGEGRASQGRASDAMPGASPQGDGSDSKAERQAERERLFEESLETLLPVAPEDVERFLDARDALEGATEPGPASMRNRTRVLEAGVRNEPTLVRLTRGYSSTLLFQDVTGAPWPVLSVILGDPGAFALTQPKVGREAENGNSKDGRAVENVHSHIVNIVPLTNHASSNLVLTLEGADYPIVLHLVTESVRSKGRTSDALTVFRIGRSGPNARTLPLGPEESGVSDELLAFVHGIAPAGATRLKLQPADAGIEVWEYRGMLYVRSVFQAVWPAWTAGAAMEGHTLYVMPKTPSLVFSKEGRRQAYIVKGLAYGAEQ